MKKITLMTLVIFMLNTMSFSQTFVDINADLIDVSFTIATFGDFDNDADMDLLLAGEKQDLSMETILYNYVGNDVFTPAMGNSFPPLEIGAVVCADFNNDNYIDILIQGLNGDTYLGYTKIHQNNGDGTFTELSLGLDQAYMGDVSCADFNNDSYIDIAITGYIEAAPYYVSKIYKNNGNGTFTELPGANLPGTMYGKLKWADYDNDGYQDFVLTGWENTYVSEIYKNNGDETFSNSGISIHQGWLGDVEWADYNGDGNIDLAISGTGGAGDERYTILYKNNGNGTFTDVNAGFPGVSHGSLEWADFDGDNNLDILICGTETTPGGGDYISSIFMNDGDGTFTESTTALLPPVYWGDSKVADYDNDGKPDILLSGLNVDESPYTAIFKNVTQSTNFMVTFRVNMSNETISPNGIHIAGSFQEWNPGTTLMTDIGDNIYEYSHNFSESETIEYKFINGNQMDDAENVPSECAQNDNRYLTIPAHDTVLTTVCFGSCSPCGDICVPPYDLTATLDYETYDAIYLLWSDSVNREFIGYNIYRDGIVIEELWQDNIYTDADLQAGNIYCYQVTTMYSDCGESYPSNEACTQMYVGLGELGENEISLYPNPASNSLNITSIHKITNLTVTNYIGHIVYASEIKDATKVELVTSSYQPGVYLIKINTENGVVTKRVIITR